MLYHHLFILILYCTSNIRPISAWDVPSSNQYHIQTDEGPERYFRYQTDSGQYRKEKRLEDGTVVGTYAWIDDNGMLQKKDYIADDSGYRILKTTNVFVGRNVPIGQAVKSIAKYNTLSKNFLSPYKNSVQPTSFNTVTSTTPTNVLESTKIPLVEITPSSYSKPIFPLLPINNTATYIGNDNYISTESPTYYQSTTPSITEYTDLSTLKQIPRTNIPNKIDSHLYNNNIYKEINENSLQYNPYINQADSSYNFHNGPTYPLDSNGKPYFGQTNKRKEYQPQYTSYDDVSVTNDGFRYYIPRAYHEEETLPGNKRSGSFGYIDPFGIRRVIYYNTAPGSGFQHKKNNRYVGFQATPYDPRPY